jgi:hypothetical protein
MLKDSIDILSKKKVNFGLRAPHTEDDEELIEDYSE